MKHPALRFAILLLAVGVTRAAAAQNFVAGADCSLLPFFESKGIAYKTNGVAGDAISILKNCGINCIRLRLFTSSAAQAQADPYDYINNLAYTVPLAQRVKKAGLQFMLDFHYSDTWADPGHQAVPSAWTNLTFPQLVQQMHDYSSNCIVAFKNAGAMPDYVQIGNEITAGILWTNGELGGSGDQATQWANLAQLLNAGIQGVKDGAGGTNVPRLVIHIDRGGDWAGTQWFFDNLIETQHVAFDIIGESYYPFYHGPMSNLVECISNAAIRYGKPVFIAETAFPWTNSVWTTNIDGFSGTVNGQLQYAVALAQAVKSVTNSLGAGIFWWSSEYQEADGVNEAGYNTTSFFDANGNLLPAAGALGAAAAPLVVNAGLSNSFLILNWPLSGAGMKLVSSTGLNSSPAAWAPVTNPVQSSGTTFRTTISINSNASRFYRLQGN